MGGIGRASDMAAAAVALTCCRAVPDGLKWPLSRALDEKRRDVWFGVIRGGRFLRLRLDPIADLRRRRAAKRKQNKFNQRRRRPSFFSFLPPTAAAATTTTGLVGSYLGDIYMAFRCLRGALPSPFMAAAAGGTAKINQVCADGVRSAYCGHVRTSTVALFSFVQLQHPKIRPRNKRCLDEIDRPWNRSSSAQHRSLSSLLVAGTRVRHVGDGGVHNKRRPSAQVIRVGLDRARSRFQSTRRGQRHVIPVPWYFSALGRSSRRTQREMGWRAKRIYLRRNVNEANRITASLGVVVVVGGGGGCGVTTPSSCRRWNVPKMSKQVGRSRESDPSHLDDVGVVADE